MSEPAFDRFIIESCSPSWPAVRSPVNNYTKCFSRQTLNLLENDVVIKLIGINFGIKFSRSAFSLHARRQNFSSGAILIFSKYFLGWKVITNKDCFWTDINVWALELLISLLYFGSNLQNNSNYTLVTSLLLKFSLRKRQWGILLKIIPHAAATRFSKPYKKY